MDYCDTEWFALETNRGHSVVFETVSRYCISDSSVDYEGYSISSKGFLPTVVDVMVNKKVRNAILGCNFKNRMISVRFQDQSFNITVIQVYVPTTNAEEAEVEQFYEDLPDLLELTPKKYVLFIIGDWNARVESQLPGVPSKFGQEYKMKQGKG